MIQGGMDYGEKSIGTDIDNNYVYGYGSLFRDR